MPRGSRPRDHIAWNACLTTALTLAWGGFTIFSTHTLATATYCAGAVSIMLWLIYLVKGRS